LGTRLTSDFFTAEECEYKMNTKMMEKQTRKGTGRTTTVPRRQQTRT
jgi:hypothetical protein